MNIQYITPKKQTNTGRTNNQTNKQDTRAIKSPSSHHSGRLGPDGTGMGRGREGVEGGDGVELGQDG